MLRPSASQPPKVPLLPGDSTNLSLCLFFYSSVTTPLVQASHFLLNLSCCSPTEADCCHASAYCPPLLRLGLGYSCPLPEPLPQPLAGFGTPSSASPSADSHLPDSSLPAPRSASRIKSRCPFTWYSCPWGSCPSPLFWLSVALLPHLLEAPGNNVATAVRKLLLCSVLCSIPDISSSPSLFLQLPYLFREQCPCLLFVPTVSP